MQLLTPIAPRVIPGRAIDFLNVAPSRGMSRGFACVDPQRPRLLRSSARPRARHAAHGGHS